MSKISLKPNASGTGVFSLEAPNSNVDRTLDLPDEAGTVLTNVSDIESQVKTATNATGSAPVYACRAWVNFDGTGTVSISASGNVSSITDNGTGNYTVNFTTAMVDANFATGFSVNLGASFNDVSTRLQNRTTSSVDILHNEATNPTDTNDLCVSVFR